MGLRRCCSCPGCAPCLRLVSFPFLSLGLGGLTMSEEGGLEELPEFFLSIATLDSNKAIFSRAALSRASRFLICASRLLSCASRLATCFSSLAIRLSLASIARSILFYEHGRKT